MAFFKRTEFFLPDGSILKIGVVDGERDAARQQKTKKTKTTANHFVSPIFYLSDFFFLENSFF
jgi:hypothetical protein